jgi:hypothetical protein
MTMTMMMEKVDKKVRKLVTIEGILHLKADINRLYIKRQNGGLGLDDLEYTYNAAIFGLSENIKQGKDKCTRLLQEYDARETIYFLQKENKIVGHKKLLVEVF